MKLAQRQLHAGFKESRVKCLGQPRIKRELLRRNPRE